jgi:hypothetical protein
VDPSGGGTGCPPPAGKEQALTQATTVTLGPAERAKLALANRLRTELAQGHGRACVCEPYEDRRRPAAIAAAFSQDLFRA